MYWAFWKALCSKVSPVSGGSGSSGWSTKVESSIGVPARIARTSWTLWMFVVAMISFMWSSQSRGAVTRCFGW